MTDGFVAHHGLVKYRAGLGRKYPRDGLCEVCGRPPAKIKPFLMFDHCHAHGWTRGLVCHVCNDQLGFLDNGQTSKPTFRVHMLPLLMAHQRNCPDCAAEIVCPHVYPNVRHIIGVRICRICD